MMSISFRLEILHVLTENQDLSNANVVGTGDNADSITTAIA